MLTTLAITVFLISNSPPVDSPSRLEIDGTPGIRFKGFCISADKQKPTNFEGTIPTRISVDINIEKCSIQKEKTAGGNLSVRLFQDRKLVEQKMADGPTIGVDFVIPLGKKKR